MGQRRISEAVISTTEVSELLGMRPANVAKTLSRGLHPETREVEVLVDDHGQVLAQKVLIGRRPMWGYHRDHVEQIKRARDADPVRRAADAKRRETARANANGRAEAEAVA